MAGGRHAPFQEQPSDKVYPASNFSPICCMIIVPSRNFHVYTIRFLFCCGFRQCSVDEISTPGCRNWPNSQIPECTYSISHNTPFRTEMRTLRDMQRLHSGMCEIGLITHTALQWRHIGRDCAQITILTILYSTVYSGSYQIEKTSKLRVTGLCVGNSPWTNEFPAQMASNAENVSI